jgi:putative spermidine/putrescine transport system substrate-binding protein
MSPIGRLTVADDALLAKGQHDSKRGNRSSTMTDRLDKKGISRRSILKGGAAATGAALGSGAITGFPTIWAQNIKDVTLRQFGTGVSNLNEVAQQGEGRPRLHPGNDGARQSDSVTQRAATQPDSFDIADIEYWICKKVWPTGNLQAMDTSKIKNYDKIVGIFRNGKLTPESTIAQGTAPHTVGFVEGGRQNVRRQRIRLDDPDPDHLQRRYAGHPPRPDRPADQQLVGAAESPNSRARPRSSTSRRSASWTWRWLWNPWGNTNTRQGQHDPEEIDKTIGIFTEAKKNGQFRAFWKTFDESVNLMASGEVVIQSMWSPAITAVKLTGHPLRLPAA